MSIIWVLLWLKSSSSCEGLFSKWCGNNNLTLNEAKTKVMVVDFRRKRTNLYTMAIKGEGVKVLEEYSYLDVLLNQIPGSHSSTCFPTKPAFIAPDWLDISDPCDKQWVGQ